MNETWIISLRFFCAEISTRKFDLMKESRAHFSTVRRRIIFQNVCSMYIHFHACFLAYLSNYVQKICAILFHEWCVCTGFLKCYNFTKNKHSETCNKNWSSTFRVPQMPLLNTNALIKILICLYTVRIVMEIYTTKRSVINKKILKSPSKICIRKM